MFPNIRVVLSHPLHPGNIGMAARAMKNMGLTRLYLVNPHRFPDKEAFYRSSHAEDVVRQAVVTSTLSEALAGCTIVWGTSARDRVMPQPMMLVRHAAEKMVNDFKDQEMAIVFGNEQFGLSNEELECCQYHIRIPTMDDYSSLNLAAAVQVVAYEIKMAKLLQAQETYLPASKKNRFASLATIEELSGLFQHMQQALIQIGFLDPLKPRKVMPRLRRIINRSHIDRDDLDLLRGIMSAVQTPKKKSSDEMS